ncbi:GH23122 [Drosophila grimshawi]|uniref:cysteine--tRNA ligase n=2 Tax=Drosophila grimshawi TaxID=7222 RepID=B4JVG9_DROGR|nr:GH23122 [Drosophila grimshawi]
MSKNSNAETQIDGYRWQKPCGEDTGIQIYNHTVRGKVPLVLRNPHVVTWYTCGPTVYDKTHVGHASTYVKVDIIQRILRDYFKYNLVTAMNITDVDDKIIKRSRETGRNWLELAQAFAAEFKLDMHRLNVKPPNLRAHVSANIATIQLFIEQLLATQQAYVSQDNSVYFDVASCASYGKLEKLLQLQESNPQSSGKRTAADFALWKAKKEGEAAQQDEPSWEASWGGVGRPGWHIECSAIAGKFFGRQLDIHAGGLDLRFPHHENEEAQCCAHYETDQWVNYWLHTGQLHLVGDEHKMSKSRGNTISVEEMLTKYTADEFRMACLLSNYRNAMPYGDSLMITARQTLRKFKNFHADLSAYMQFQKPLKLLDEGALQAQLKHTMLEFDNSLRDDFDTARALAVLMDQMSSISRCINEQQSDAEQEPAYCLDLLLAAGNFIGNAMQNFGITPFDQQQQEQLNPTTDINALIGDLLAVRRQLREKAIGESVIQNRQMLAVCDQLRDLLQRHGFQVRDHKHGSSWTLVEQKSASSSA